MPGNFTPASVPMCSGVPPSAVQNAVLAARSVIIRCSCAAATPDAFRGRICAHTGNAAVKRLPKITSMCVFMVTLLFGAVSQTAARIQPKGKGLGCGKLRGRRHRDHRQAPALFHPKLFRSPCPGPGQISLTSASRIVCVASYGSAPLPACWPRSHRSPYSRLPWISRSHPAGSSVGDRNAHGCCLTT